MKRSSYILLGQAIAIFGAIPLLMLAGKHPGSNSGSGDDANECRLDTCIDISGQPFNTISIEYDSEVLTEQIQTSGYFNLGFDISDITVTFTDTLSQPELRTVSRSGWALSAFIDGTTLKLFVSDMTADADYDYSPNDSIIINLPRNYPIKRIVQNVTCPTLTIGNAALQSLDIGAYGNINISDSQIADLTLFRGLSREASSITLEQSQLKTLEIGPDQNFITLSADPGSTIDRLLWLTADSDSYYNTLTIEELSHTCEMTLAPGVEISTNLTLTVYKSPEIETSNN